MGGEFFKLNFLKKANAITSRTYEMRLVLEGM